MGLCAIVLPCNTHTVIISSMPWKHSAQLCQQLKMEFGIAHNFPSMWVPLPEGKHFGWCSWLERCPKVICKAFRSIHCADRRIPWLPSPLTCTSTALLWSPYRCGINEGCCQYVRRRIDSRCSINNSELPCRSQPCVARRCRAQGHRSSHLGQRPGQSGWHKRKLVPLLRARASSPEEGEVCGRDKFMPKLASCSAPAVRRGRAPRLMLSTLVVSYPGGAHAFSEREHWQHRWVSIGATNSTDFESTYLMQCSALHIHLA